MGYSWKIQTGDWGYGISRGIKEIACGICKGSLKIKEWNFQGFALAISKRSNTILWNIQGLSFFRSGISRDKVKNEKFQRSFQTIISSIPHVWIFSGTAQWSALLLLEITTYQSVISSSYRAGCSIHSPLLASGGRNKCINKSQFIILIFVKMNLMTIDHYRDKAK